KAGWKFNEYEMKGITVCIEMGARDIEKEQVVLVRRDTGEKEFVPMSELEERLPNLLEEVQQNLYDQALAHRKENTSTATTMEEFKQTDRKSTRLNSSHVSISYAVVCLNNNRGQIK